MLLKPTELTVDPADPFKNDALKRAGQAEMLTRVIGDLKVPFVLAIDSSFGTGKTTFIKMWRAKLHNDGFSTIHFNAWENDFTENALISLLGELRESLKLAGGENKLAKMSLKVGAAFVKHGASAVIKAATSGLIDSEKIAEAVSDMTGKLAEEHIKKYEEEKKTITSFRSELEAFVKDKSPAKPLLFFVDELDRCRPLFAIEVLEHIKHLFSVSGIVFVLAVDKTQLGHSLRAVYGAGLDVDGYLARFIDLTYPLPTPKLEGFVESLLTRFGHIDELVSQNGRRADPGNLYFALLVLNRLCAIPLRTMEQIVTQFILAWKLLADPHASTVLLLTLIIVRRMAPDRYKQLISGTEKFEREIEIVREIIQDQSQDDLLRSAAADVLSVFRVFGLNKEQFDNLKSKIQSETRDAVNKDQDGEILWTRMGYYFFGGNRRKSLVDTIELAQVFIPKDR